MMMIMLRMGAALLAVTMACSAAPADSTDDLTTAKVRSICAKWSAEWWAAEKDSDRTQHAARRAVEGLDVNSLRGVHIGLLLNHDAMTHMAGIRGALRERLEAFVEDEGPDGAVAAIQLFHDRFDELETLEQRVRLYRERCNHPGLSEAVKLGAANQVLLLRRPDTELIPHVIDVILGLERFLTPEAVVHLAPSFDWYFELLSDIAAAGHDVELQRIRKKLVALAGEALPRIEPEGRREYVEGVINHLNGAAARGELLNHAAPATQFLWTSDPNLTSLRDLQGRVVALEFWATWCGPCVRAFPKLRELQEHYSNSPVTIVGATVLEDHFITASGKNVPVDQDINRAAELMSEYIATKEITWPIVFCDDRTITDFGVRVIPTMFLIDARGIVRHAGLHTGADAAALRAMIDELVREAAAENQGRSEHRSE